jgi:hypothetical protein
LQRSVSDYIRSNFFITAAGMLNPALLHHALSATSIDGLIFSTDYPFQQPTRDEIDSFPRAILFRRRPSEVFVGQRGSPLRPRQLFKELARDAHDAAGRKRNAGQ